MLEINTDTLRPNSFRNTKISSGIRTSARRTPNKISLSMGDQQVTYRNLVSRLNKVAVAGLDGLGLCKGDHVALFSSNCIEFIEIVVGLADVGIATAMIPPSVTVPEVEYICNNSKSKILFCHENLEDIARAANLETVKKIIVIGKDYEALISSATNSLENITLEEWDVFSIPYTSGTTGKPKGCLLSHRSRVMAFYIMGVEFGCYSPDDRALALAPLFHGAGFAFALAPIFFGGTCEILPKFDPELVLERLSKMSLTNTFFVPTHFHQIFSLDNKFLQSNRPKNLRAIISNAAPLPQSTKEKIIDYFGEDLLHETYGSTEGGFVTNLRPKDQLVKEKCVGLAYPTVEVSLRDNQGNEVKQGDVGEVYVRSPILFNGYWENETATREAVDEDGWCTVGDLGKNDEDGYLYLVDRKKDMIISGGINIFPREIEEVLARHPDIKECAVFGVDDKYWGESVSAVIVTNNNQIISDEELKNFCKNSLAKYKLPKKYSYMDALPRNAGGKILKRELKRMEEIGRIK